ncbi:MAG TPA: universal stress protein [Ilumatobacteraceae bacterium]|nr:universal stress protein [Ilumatobacteraceae bacterium]
MGEIIVGLDGSDASRAALRWAARTSAAQGSGIRAITAWQYPSSAATPAGPARLPGPEEMDERTCDEARSIVREELGADADRASVEAGRGPAAPVLLDAAARAGTEILVLGARGLGGFAGLMLGSVSHECVEHSPCPVVVLRGGPDPSDGPIVVGLDGSEGAARALDWAADLAEATGARLVAVHAPIVGANNATVNAARTALDQWCAPLVEREVPHEVRVEPGDARTTLERVADESDASLVVVGTRGLGAIRGLLLGSVAGYIARYSERPIAIVPRSER